jgi:hypothetical protein
MNSTLFPKRIWLVTAGTGSTSAPELEKGPERRQETRPSTPDPITLASTPPQAARTRMSRRQNAGIPPQRFENEQWDQHGRALSALSAIGITKMAIPEGLKT